MTCLYFPKFSFVNICDVMNSFAYNQWYSLEVVSYWLNEVGTLCVFIGGPYKIHRWLEWVHCVYLFEVRTRLQLVGVGTFCAFIGGPYKTNSWLE